MQLRGKNGRTGTHRRRPDDNADGRTDTRPVERGEDERETDKGGKQHPKPKGRGERLVVCETNSPRHREQVVARTPLPPGASPAEKRRDEHAEKAEHVNADGTRTGHRPNVPAVGSATVARRPVPLTTLHAPGAMVVR